MSVQTWQLLGILLVVFVVLLFVFGRWSLLVMGVVFCLIAIASLIVGASIECPGGDCSGDYVLYSATQDLLAVVGVVSLTLGLFTIRVAQRRIQRHRVRTEGFVNTDFEVDDDKDDPAGHDNCERGSVDEQRRRSVDDP